MKGTVVDLVEKGRGLGDGVGPGLEPTDGDRVGLGL
jgi:hypothetical protein